MSYKTKMLQVESFTFGKYHVDPASSVITFTYHVEFKDGKVRTYNDKLLLPKVNPDLWDKVPNSVLDKTLQALLLMLGINYWCVFPTKNIKVSEFTLTQDQAKFWDSIYLNGLGEFFYDMKIDFRNLISFPYDNSATAPTPAQFTLPKRSLLLNGAGKDSILSAEILRSSNIPFDFFSFAPTPAHKKISKLVGAKNITVTRHRDPSINRSMFWMEISNAYPSVSTFTFIAVLLAELLGYDSIIFSNERSADFGNFTYLDLEVNHQWCKSSVAEEITNDYIQKFITPNISTKSTLRKYSELEIVKRFVQYPKYLRQVTSCNTYFWLPRPIQLLQFKSYWCKRCPKCVFLFACFSAFLPKEEVVKIFGDDLYAKRNLLPLFLRILGTEGFKPLDCVGEPEEMILAMHYAYKRGEYASEPAMKIFEKHFATGYDFAAAEKRVFSEE